MWRQCLAERRSTRRGRRCRQRRRGGHHRHAPWEKARSPPRTTTITAWGNRHQYWRKTLRADPSTPISGTVTAISAPAATPKGIASTGEPGRNASQAPAAATREHPKTGPEPNATRRTAGATGAKGRLGPQRTPARRSRSPRSGPGVSPMTSPLRRSTTTARRVRRQPTRWRGASTPSAATRDRCRSRRPAGCDCEPGIDLLRRLVCRHVGRLSQIHPGESGVHTCASQHV